MPRLNRLADDLWEARDTLRMPGGVVFPLRMTVLRAGDGLLVQPVGFLLRFSRNARFFFDGRA